MTGNRYKKEVKSIIKLIKQKEKLKKKVKRLDRKLNDGVNNMRDISCSSEENTTQGGIDESEEESPQTQVADSEKHLIARFTVTRRKKRHHGIVNISRRKRNYRKDLQILTELLRQKAELEEVVKKLTEDLNEKANLLDLSWTSEANTTQGINDESFNGSVVSEEESPQTPMADNEQKHYQSPMEDSEQNYYQMSPVSASKKHQEASSSLNVGITKRCRSIARAVRKSKRLASLKATEAIRALFAAWTISRIKTRLKGNIKEEINEGEESSDWKEGIFNWIKFTKYSKNIPGILLPKREGMARSITLKGTLSLYTFSIYESQERIDEKLKNKRYQRALKVFNSRNGCSYY